MNNIGSKILPIAPYVAFIKIQFKKFILAIDSILVQDYIPNEVVIIDGYVSNEIRSFGFYPKFRRYI